MTVRIAVQFPTVVSIGAWPDLEVSRAMRADYADALHRNENGADPCLYRLHDVDHPATVRLTPDPDAGLSFAHTDTTTVCTCCAFGEGHLYEEMLGQATTSGHVDVELRGEDGRWI